MASTRDEFHERGYALLKGVLPSGALQMLHHYCLSYAKGEHAATDALVPGTPAGYGHPCMERILLQIVPLIENATGRTVFPTYSYFRVYRRGDVLPRHVDRPACEISLSLCIGYTGTDDWPLWLRGPKGDASVSLRPGEGVAYKGTELEHWREPFAGESAAQVFLHYVDRAGPHADWRFDKRPSLRLTGN